MEKINNKNKTQTAPENKQRDETLFHSLRVLLSAITVQWQVQLDWPLCSSCSHGTVMTITKQKIMNK